MVLPPCMFSPTSTSCLELRAFEEGVILLRQQRGGCLSEASVTSPSLWTYTRVSLYRDSHKHMVALTPVSSLQNERLLEYLDKGKQ